VLGVYRELTRLHREEALDFSRVITFNLDEYLGVSPDHPHSFHHFMLENFFSQVNVDPRHIHIPTAPLPAHTKNIARPTRRRYVAPVESICKFSASDATGTSVQ